MNSKPVRFVLSGYYGFGNLGDDALLEVIVSQLRTRFPYATIDVLSETPELTAQQLRVEATPRSNLRAVHAAIEKGNVLLSGGGGLLQNATSLKSLLYYTGIINTATRRRLKTMIFAQSIGPLDSLGRRMVAQLCNRIDLATVRDGRSEQLLRRILPDRVIERTADPVFLYDSAAPPDPQTFMGLDEAAGPIAVISIRRSAQSDRVVRLLADIVDRLAQQHHIQSVFVPLGGPGDADVATQVIRRCRSKPLLLPECDLNTVSALIKRSKLVVGMRLHALILAARFAVPFLALAYDPKVNALLEDLAYPLPLLWNAEKKMVESDAPGLLDRVVHEHAALTDHLQAQSRLMRIAAERNFDLIEALVG